MKAERMKVVMEKDTGRVTEAVTLGKSLHGLPPFEVMVETDGWFNDGLIRSIRSGDWGDDDGQVFVTSRLFRFADKSSLMVLILPTIQGHITAAFDRASWAEACQVIEAEQVPEFVVEFLNQVISQALESQPSVGHC